MSNEDKINIILLELLESDKYGIEIANNLKAKSIDFFSLKQTQLYALLKNMEKSNMIESYWKDSQIGGKRHYYKLTSIGRKKATLSPTINAILNKISMEKYSYFGKIDNFDNNNDFNNSNLSNDLDIKTNYELNKDNNKLVNNYEDNRDVELFSTKQLSPIFETKEQKVKLSIEKNTVFDENLAKKETLYKKDKLDFNVKREDYINFDNNKRMILYRKHISNTKNLMFSSAFIQFILIISMLLLCSVFNNKIFGLLSTFITVIYFIYNSFKGYYRFNEIKYDIYDNKKISFFEKNLLKTLFISLLFIIIFSSIIIFVNAYNFLNYTNYFYELIVVFIGSLFPIFDYLIAKLIIHLNSNS